MTNPRGINSQLLADRLVKNNRLLTVDNSICKIRPNPATFNL
jgi:hypothetical protein